MHTAPMLRRGAHGHWLAREPFAPLPQLGRTRPLASPDIGHRRRKGKGGGGRRQRKSKKGEREVRVGGERKEKGREKREQEKGRDHGLVL